MFIIVLVFCSSFVLAEQIMPSLVINEDKGVCGYYMPLVLFNRLHHDLPSSWDYVQKNITYEHEGKNYTEEDNQDSLFDFNENTKTIITTKYGTCVPHGYTIRGCCEQLGLQVAHVPSSKPHLVIVQLLTYFIPLILIIAVVISPFYFHYRWKKKRQKKE